MLICQNAEGVHGKKKVWNPWPRPRPVVLNFFFYITYHFIKQDYQIYPQYIRWSSFIKNTKLMTERQLV